MMQSVGLVEARDAYADEVSTLDDILGPLDEAELDRPSGCDGWTNAALVYHMLLDAQRALVTFSSPADGPATKNFVDYWNDFQADDPWAVDHMRFVVISADAHKDPRTIVHRWRETASASARRASEVRTEFVATQGHVLATADFIATLVVEATIHHLDLIANLSAPGPARAAIVLTVKTLDGLLRTPRPAGWSDLTYIRKLTGRERLEPGELGAAAVRIPVFS